MKKNFLMMALVCLFTVVAISSCNKDEKSTSVEVTEVTLDKTAITLVVNSSETLTATVKPDDADDKTVVWTTNDAAKVTVTNGTVTAIAEGSAIVTATAGDKSATCEVTVINNSGSIGYTLTVTVENGSSYNGKIDNVKVLYDPYSGEYDEAAESVYNNGGFTLNLSETVPDKYLRYIELPAAVNVSNPNAKTTTWDLSIFAYKQNTKTGEFLFGATGWEGTLMYSTEDVSITGSYSSYGKTHTYNVHLKKGWNIMYGKYPDNEEYGDFVELTTQAPDGVKWTFVESLLLKS
jgi:hypothetical protein